MRGSAGQTARLDHGRHHAGGPRANSPEQHRPTGAVNCADVGTVRQQQGHRLLRIRAGGVHERCYTGVGLRVDAGPGFDEAFNDAGLAVRGRHVYRLLPGV